jgi:hypothetical protein
MNETEAAPRPGRPKISGGARPFANDGAESAGAQLKPEQRERIRAKALGVSFKSLVEHAETPIDQSQTLLGNRWLCRGAVALVVAPSGVGKSSAVQGEMATKFSCGKEAFGIKPSRALKILIIQAENDQGDTTEMLRDVVRKLSPEDKKLVAQNTWCSEPVADFTALNFIFALRIWIDEFKPDVTILDPMNAYTGGDPSDPSVLTPFFRQWLLPLLKEKGVGCIVIHHMPKTRGWDTSKWKHTDFMYMGAGNAEQTNVARAVLVMDSTDNPMIYKFIATKRRQHIGWAGGEGAAPGEWWVRYYKHSNTGIAWDEAEKDEVAVVKAKATAKKRKFGGKYPLPVVLTPLLNADDQGLTCRELHRHLARSGSDISENCVWKKLSKASFERFVETDKDGRYTLTQAGLELFS